MQLVHDCVFYRAITLSDGHGILRRDHQKLPFIPPVGTCVRISHEPLPLRVVDVMFHDSEEIVCIFFESLDLPEHSENSLLPLLFQKVENQVGLDMFPGWELADVGPEVERMWQIHYEKQHVPQRL